MTVYPAIDLQGGRQVGLVGGDLGRRRAYGEAAVFARDRAAEGFAGLHVVDLDGAGQGHPAQLETVAAIRAAAPGLLLEVGGGVRTVEDALAVRRAGADRVVVGTAAVRALLAGAAAADRGSLVADLLSALGPEALAVALDGRPSGVALDAWREHARADLRALGERLGALGLTYVVHTDTERDGTLAGSRTEAVASLAATGLRVIAGGGARDDEDLARLAAVGAMACVVGRAFHAGVWRPRPQGVTA